MLLASSSSDFERRIQQRELATCPPVADSKGYAYNARGAYDLGGKKYCPLILHHAAAFAVVCWTNLFFPAKCGLFGDVIGGPIEKTLGLGVLDIPVSTRKWRGVLDRMWFSHTHYWWCTSGPATPAVQALRGAIGLTKNRV
jgi:hypothetical protein